MLFIFYITATFSINVSWIEQIKKIKLKFRYFKEVFNFSMDASGTALAYSRFYLKVLLAQKGKKGTFDIFLAAKCQREKTEIFIRLGIIPSLYLYLRNNNNKF